ncbi:RNA polymerase sigma factor [Saccharopolyspora phatthalungensis]|uniref:RNA polymerase sigma factor n=1 Tax=Saccharopolyspora phatthalungensis TaxID=664693 RepID=A0A840Q5U2_9PSEU|nr:sigma-70 family RNA polymerase sigma factor [Saccharopolyspora phatthalungensis]MBB5154098.1 RNA polymerase sigma-70 factor (ECF subfamily) [Saccharopolyspora phatthalungensis]
MEPTDAVLATRIAAGDVDAFELLARRFSDGVFGMALRMLGDRAEAEDVVQDVLVTVWRRSGELAEPAALRTWLFQVARRNCLIVLRRRRTRRTEPVGVVPEHRPVVGAAVTTADPQRIAEAAAGVLALRRALAGLPAQQRDVWLLAEVDGLSYIEIGHRVGVGEQAVRGRLSRARATLADMMRAWR